MEIFNTLCEKDHLREVTFDWKIDPVDRSWFIKPDGSILSEMSHRIMLKKLFPSDWERLKSRNIEDGEIEEVFTNRLIQTGWIKIGELDKFYSTVLKLNDRTKDVLYSFVVSLLKIRKDESDKEISIYQSGINSTTNMTLNDIAKDKLYTLKEEAKNFDDLYKLIEFN